MRHKVNIKIALLLTCMFLSAFGAKVSAQSSTVYTINGGATGVSKRTSLASRCPEWSLIPRRERTELRQILKAPIC